MWFRRRAIPVVDLGRLGERRAVWFYRLRAYRIVGRNVRLRSGEIDLLARRGSTLAVVEVKTRQSLTAGEGYEAVDSRKRTRIPSVESTHFTLIVSEASTVPQGFRALEGRSIVSLARTDDPVVEAL